MFLRFTCERFGALTSQNENRNAAITLPAVGTERRHCNRGTIGTSPVAALRICYIICPHPETAIATKVVREMFSRRIRDCCTA
jgi:hypothetical protein